VEQALRTAYRQLRLSIAPALELLQRQLDTNQPAL